jgi:protein-S-isoprenylcysteine O-methyltransferase Ste14
LDFLRWVPAGFAILYTAWMTWEVARRRGNTAGAGGSTWTTVVLFSTLFLNLVLSASEAVARDGPILLPAVAGMFLLTLKFWITARCLRILGSQYSFHIALAPESRLVRTGPYSWCRHPMYTGRVLATLGIPLCFNAWWCMGIFTAVDGITLHCRIREEERILHATFGKAYDRYRREVRALIPGPVFWKPK